jgi:endonuclease/exonuclease/phosphatase family metal-dependent hydrolase
VEIVPPDPDIAHPPDDVAGRVAAFAPALDQVVAAKELDRNLLVGSWNLRAFGGLTKKWQSAADDSPKRDLADVLAIATVLSRFDVVAVQEVRSDLRALRHLLKALGPDWGFTLTDVTKGPAGNDERMAFLFDTRRVTPSGLACEIVMPEDDPRVPPMAFARQFARTPYAVSFASAGKTFILVTLHVVYGKTSSDRIDELSAIAQWLAGWATEAAEWGHNLICLGDFNIDRKDDPLFQAFTSTGLTSSPALNTVPRTIFDTPGAGHFYDQIAWFVDDTKGPALSLRCTNAGSFDFVPLWQRDQTTTELSWRISDHYPLWVEFSVQ